MRSMDQLEELHEPARGLWTSLGRLPLRVFSIGKYAFQKKLEELRGCDKRLTAGMLDRLGDLRR